MRELSIDLKEIPSSLFQEILENYKDLTESQLLANSFGVGVSAMFKYAESLMEINEEVTLTVTSENSIIFKSIVSKDLTGIKIDSQSLSDFFQVPLEEVLSLGLNPFIEHDQPFVHPLSEIKGDLMNTYAMGSMLINGMRLKGDYGDPHKCENFLVSTIMRINPEKDINLLIGRVKLHEVSAMYEVCTILSEMSKLAH